MNSKVTHASKRSANPRECSQYTRSLIEASLDPLVTISPQGKITDVNQATEMVTGVTREQLIGSDFSDYFTEPDKAREGYQQVYLRGMVTDYPLTIRHASGRLTDVLYNASVYKNESGEVQGVFAAARDITEQKRAEARTREALQYTRSLIEASLDPLVTISPQGKITDVNQATEMVTGVTREQLIGSDFSDYFTEPDKAREGYQQVYSRGTVTDYPLTIRHASGRLADVLYNASVYKNESGEVQGIFAAARDITERKQAENEWKKSELEFRTLYESSSDAVMLADEKSFLDCNDTTLKIFGCKSKEEFCGKHPADLSPANQPCGTNSMTLSNERIATAVQTGHNHFEWMHKRLDSDETFPAEVSINTIDLDGRQLLQAVVRDITERKRAEEALESNERKLRTITDAALDAVIMIDSAGNVAYWNPAAEAIFGYSSEEILGQGVHGILTPSQHRDAASRGFSRFVSSGQGAAIGKTLELTALRKDGTEFSIEISVNSIRQDGNWWAVAVVRDITERKQAEQRIKDYAATLENNNLALVQLREAAEEANRAKSEFLANMSHEIRTPMTAILGFTDILIDDLEEPDALESAQIVKRNGEQLLKIINDILDISKIEAGRFELEEVPWSPREVVGEVIALLHVRAAPKGLTLTDEYPGPQPEVIITDPVRLRQILVNLVGNAVKFTETGGVRIVTHLLDAADGEPKLRFDVIDTGIGIPEEQVDKVFGAFVQADGSATRDFGGTGLGLAISRRLARLMGGDVTAKSEPGKGSTFSLTVATGPLEGVRLMEYIKEAAPVSERPDQSTPASKQMLQCRILLAEDIPDNQRLVASVLRNVGADVTIVENGQEALEKALAASSGWGRRHGDSDEPFDVILMDMQMPVLDGYKATGRLRREGYTGPIIALTAHAMRDDRQKCLDAGCDDYLTKPVDRKKLAETVARWVSKRQQPEAADLSQGEER